MSIAPVTSSPATAAPELRPVKPEDYPQIQKLESEHGLLTLPVADWRELGFDNPARPRSGQDRPVGWVLEAADGRIVGSLGNVATRYIFKGRELISVTGRGWVVREEYRGMALWLMDEYFNQHADLFINTTVNSMAVDPFTVYDSRRVPLGDWETAAFWVTSYRGFARTALRIKHSPAPSLFAIPASVALRVKDALTAQHLPPSPASVDFEIAETFDARFEAFWGELVQSNPDRLLAVRDLQTLLWHFAGPMRRRELWVATASRGGMLRAYGVFKRQDHPQSGLVRMRLVDHQSLDPGDDLLCGILHTALSRCAADGIHTLESVGCGLEKIRTFDRYAPYRRKLPAWPFYYKATDSAVDAALRNPQAWDPSSYDGDASL